MTKPPANVLNLPLEQRAEMALKAAVERVLVEELGKVAHLHPARSRQLHWDVMWEFIVGMMEP